MNSEFRNGRKSANNAVAIDIAKIKGRVVMWSGGMKALAGRANFKSVCDGITN